MLPHKIAPSPTNRGDLDGEPVVSNSVTLLAFETEMKIAKLSPDTMEDRLRVLRRFERELDDKPLLYATARDLLAHQARFAHLAPASVNVYSRHLKAFYDWATRRGLIATNPAEGMLIPTVPKGRPHPATADDMRTVLACTRGMLRRAYVLAAFVGLRRGEICRLHSRDVDVSGPLATALIRGKGGRERIVPVLAPVVTELYEYGMRGWVLQMPDGRPYNPERLSIESTTYLQGIGVRTTLHSMRHTFATNAARMTKDPLFVRDLLGHSSVSTTEIYMDSDMDEAHARLAGMSLQAERMLGRASHLKAVGG